jgi:cystathionine beta-lyase
VEFDFRVDPARLRALKSTKWREFGPDVLPAWVAEMDFPLAPPIKAALAAAIERDDTGYHDPAALPPVFAAWAGRRWGWEVLVEQISILPDVVTGIAECLRRLTPVGARVVLSSPVYPPFRAVIEQVDRVAVDVPLTESGDLDLAGIGAALTAGAAAVLLCSPHNPTGRVWTVDQLQELEALAAAAGAVVLADEIHAPLTLPGATHTVFGSWSNRAAGADSVVLTSAAKAFNLAGLKCSLAVAGSARVAAALEGLPRYVRNGTGHLGALASEAAFRDGDDWLAELLVQLDLNRDILATLLSGHLPRIGYQPPEAGFLAWLDCRKLKLGDDPAAEFLRSGGVALSSGPAFGPGGAGFARLNMGTSPALLAQIVQRMAMTGR